MSIAQAIVHPTALVEDGAEIGAGVHIGPYCAIGPQVRIGDGARLQSHVVAAGRTTIGPRTQVYPFASLGHAPQDLKYRGEDTALIIGADNKIREHVTMNPGTEGGGGQTVIGDGGLFMAGSHVAHDCRIGNGVILANNATCAGHVTLGDGAILGGLCGLHQFVRVGAYAMIGGMAGVEKDVIPYGSVIGNRAALGGLNIVGMKRRGFDRATIHALRAAYRLIFDGEGDFADRAAAALKAYPDVAPVQEIADFIIAGGPRGFCTPPRRVTMTPDAKVGVICGSGALPRLVARGLIAQGRDYFLIGLKGAADPWVRGHPHATLSIGQVGGIFHALKTAGCRDVVFAGAVARPTLGTFRIDFTAARLAPRVIGFFRQGDDGLLRGLATLFEDQGFRIIGADAFVPDALAPAGPLTACKPTLRDRADIDAGAAALKALGPYDVGQAIVMARGVCLAVEAVEGTRYMLERVAGFPNHRRGGAPRPSGVLIKTPKPGQDRRFDLPAIGPDTIDQIAAAGLNGAAVAAGGVFILERAETIRRADAKGVFVFGVNPLA